MSQISIIMPCHNAARHLRRSIDSVLAQSLADWELIVVDDGSTDGSAELAAAVDDPRVRVVRQENAGSASARNRGLEEAAAPYVAFLDADDTWAPAFLELMLAALEAEPDAVLSYCGWQNLGVPGGRGEPFVPPDYSSADTAELLLGGCRWPIHGALTRREAIRDAGGFDPSLQASVDYDLWLRVAIRGALVRVPEVLAFYHHHEGEQITKNHLRVALNHWKAQRNFLAAHPGVRERLGTRRVRELLLGELLERGFRCYWARDLRAARTLFRIVMRYGYGGPRDWIYMLPSLAPLSMHRAVLDMRDRFGGRAVQR